MHSGIILCPYKPTSSGQGYGVSSSSSFANLPPPRGNQEQSSQRIVMSNLLSTIKELGKKRKGDKSRKDFIYYSLHNQE
jgi:hypothetical protein